MYATKSVFFSLWESGVPVYVRVERLSVLILDNSVIQGKP